MRWFVDKINQMKNFDLYAIIFLSILLLVIIGIVPDSNVMRIILGVPFVLFFPGYALISALWPEKTKELSNAERIGLSLGLSLAIVPLIGLSLNYTFGIKLWPILTSLSIFIVAMSAIAIIRRSRAKEPFVFEIRMEKFEWKEVSKEDRTIIMAMCVAIAIAVGILIYIIVTPRPGEAFTAIYILGPDGKAEGYPTNLSIGENATVIVGIYNHEHREVRYTIIATINDSAEVVYLNDWNKTCVLTNDTAYAINITLSHDQTWEKEFKFSIAHPGKYKVMWKLLMDGKESSYEVHLWVNVI